MSAALDLTCYQSLVLVFSAFLIVFGNRSSCIVPQLEEILSVSVGNTLQSELQARLDIIQENTAKQIKVTEERVTGPSPTPLPNNMQH